MLAIIIPYYKLTFFKEALDSLANQTDKRFKVYIGNDASPENPRPLLENYRHQVNFHYHQFENNLGSFSLVRHWERCIALTNEEEWIMILGDDDILGENVVEEFYKNLYEIQYEKIDVIRYATCVINVIGNYISDIYQRPVKENAVDFFFTKIRSSLSEYIFRKEKVLTIKFKHFPLAWFSDVLAVMEFSDFKNIYTLNNSIVYIRISLQSITGNSSFNILKRRADFEFHIYLLYNHSKFFNSFQKKYLLQKVHNSYLNNKRLISFFISITVLHLKKGWVLGYINFIKIIIKKFLK